MWVCTHCRQQRVSGVFCHSPLVPFRQGLSLNLGFLTRLSTPWNWYYRHFLECLVYYTIFEIWTLVPMMVGQALLTAETTSTVAFSAGRGLLLFLLSWEMVSCDATRPWIPDPLTTMCWNHGVRQQTWPTLHPFLVSTHLPQHEILKRKSLTYIQSHEQHLRQWTRCSLHFTNANLKQHPREKSRAALWTPVADLGISSLCVL